MFERLNRPRAWPLIAPRLVERGGAVQRALAVSGLGGPGRISLVSSAGVVYDIVRAAPSASFFPTDYAFPESSPSLPVLAGAHGEIYAISAQRQNGRIHWDGYRLEQIPANSERR